MAVLEWISMIYAMQNLSFHIYIVMDAIPNHTYLTKCVRLFPGPDAPFNAVLIINYCKSKFNIWKSLDGSLSST